MTNRGSTKLVRGSTKAAAGALSLTLHGDRVLDVAQRRKGEGRDLAPPFIFAARVGWDVRSGLRVNARIRHERAR